VPSKFLPAVHCVAFLIFSDRGIVKDRITGNEAKCILARDVATSHAPRTRRALLRNPGCLRGAGERSARREPTLKKMVGYSGFEKPASAAWSIVQAPGNRLRRTQRQRLMLSPVRAPILLTRARARAIRANDRANPEPLATIRICQQADQSPAAATSIRRSRSPRARGRHPFRKQSDSRHPPKTEEN
jgi:hypothetical protein